MTARSFARSALPALALAAGSLGLEVAYGAAPGDGVLFLAYEIGFVIVPGWLAYRALSRQPGGALRQLALGWALGYVLGILAFMVTAATGTRGLFVAYPVVVVAAAAVTALARSGVASRREVPRLSGRFVWTLVLVCLGALVYLALTFFASTPLPGARNVSYFQDYSWALSLAADAKHHWPIQDPNVSGEPMPYHYFVNIHLAAASQVTGIALPVVYLRLFICPMIIALVLQFVVAGQSLARSAHVGLAAAGLVFFVGEMQMDASHSLFSLPFTGVLFTLMLLSPSFLFGLVMFVPLVTLLGERIAPQADAAQTGGWLLVAIFIVGASDAKVSILPLVLVALLLYAASKWLVQRRVPTDVWRAGALVLLAFGAVYLLQYRGHSSGLGVDALAGVHFFNDMFAVSLVKTGLRHALPSFPGEQTVLSAGGVIFGFLGLLAAQLIGMIWILRRGGARWTSVRGWLFSLFVAGILALLFLSAPGTGNQLYFFFYAVVAGCLISAEGLRVAWLAMPAFSGRVKRLVGIGLAWILVLAGLMVAPGALSIFSGPLRSAHDYMFWYGGLALALVALYASARRWLGPQPWAALVLVSGAVLSVAVLDAPVDHVKPALANPPSPPARGRRMTPELYGALTWIRDRTAPSSVIAANNAYMFEFDYAAFAERRLFLGGWAYSQRSRDLGYGKVAGGRIDPFPVRSELNRAAFVTGSHRALETMIERYGVRYLLVDEVNGYRADTRALATVARPVYRAAGVSILRLRGDARLARYR